MIWYSIFSEEQLISPTKNSNVKNELEKAKIVFLLPHQLKYLQNKSIDLAINISSFGEMKKNQIEEYYKVIDRVTKKYFFTKQWKVSTNPFDKIKITENDYPTFQNWEMIFSRTSQVQTDFFESLYKIN